MKNKFRYLSIVIYLLLFLPFMYSPFQLVVQAQTNIENIQWLESSNVSYLKEWKVTFSGKIDPESISTNSVFVIGPEREKTGVTPYIDSTGKAILIPPPEGGYMKGITYSLHITTEVKEIKGKPLKNPVSKVFTISEHSSEDYSTMEPYVTSFEILNTSGEGKFIHLSGEADISSYTKDLRLESSSRNINHVYIPPNGTAIVSFDEIIDSPIVDTIAGITYHSTDEPAFWRINLSSESAVAFTKSTDGSGFIQINGGSYFYTDSSSPNYLNFFDESPYGHNNIDLAKNTTRSFQPNSGSEISIYATFRSYSLEELPYLFAEEYLIDPTKTTVITTDKPEARLLVDKKSNFDYAYYNSNGGIEIGTSIPQNYFNSIHLRAGSRYVLTNTGDNKFFVAGLTGTFSVQNRDEAVLQSEILDPKTNRMIINNSTLHSRVSITGQGTLDFASYNKDGSPKDFGQLTLTKDQPISLDSGKNIVLTNTGEKSIQISYPFTQHQSENTSSPAIKEETLEPGTTTIWKNLFPVYSSLRVNGTGHLEFAQYTSTGEIQNFGLSDINPHTLFWHNIAGNNASIVTNSGTTPLHLIGPYNSFTVHESIDRALQSISIESGKSLSLTPTGQSASIRALVVAEGSYEYAEYGDNYVRDFNKKNYPPGFKSEEMYYMYGEFLITNKGEKALAVYVPIHNANLQQTDESTLLEKTIYPGESITWLNSSDSPINMVLSGNGPYHYISKDYDQKIISEDRRTLSPAWTNREELLWRGALEIINESNAPIIIYGPARYLTVEGD